MATIDANSFLSATPLDSKKVLPDDIWISSWKYQSCGKKQECGHRNKSIPFSISDINDSDFYSIDEVTTTGVSSDEQFTQAKKPPLPPRKHAKQKKTSKQKKSGNQRKPHSQDQPEYISTSSATDQLHPGIQAVRSAIERLGDDPSYVQTCQAEVRRRDEKQEKTGEQSGNPDAFEANEESFSMELTNFVRKASLRTKKVFRKFKSSDLSPRTFWRRTRTEVREVVSSGSLSTADPSASYHLPQDASPISNRSTQASSAGDMDIPFSNGMAAGSRADNISLEAERGESNIELEKKTYSALRYVQKLKSKSRAGGLILRSKTRNVAEDLEGDESTFNSATREDSLRRRLARSLSF